MKKRLFALLLVSCMLLSLLPAAVSAASGPMDTIPKYDQLVDLYNRTSDFTITDSRSYYFYSSVPEKLRDQWSWKWKIQVKGPKAAPHIFIDGLNIEVSPSAKTPAIEINNQATAYLYFVGRDSTLQGATGRAAIQKNRSEGTLYVLARTGTTVTCKGGAKAAGIGGSYRTRNIFDGLYNKDMYGHGVNIHFGSQSNPDYWGGTIIADGGQGGAGVGAGRGGAGEKLYFYSGTVRATGGRWASGIGGSYEGRGSEIYIYGGNVIATGVEGGAGIGGGCWKTAQDMNGINAAHDIYISGGTVTASGGYNGAGIGGGQYVPAHDITITGGYITAKGVYGAAIGGGRWMHGKNITVTDAHLKLSAGRLDNASDAAAMGYGDLVYKPEELVKDPSVATNDAIKIGSKKKGAIVWLRVEAYALTANGRSNFFWNLSDFLIPNERGLIDVSLLTLPYVQNYGWAITELEMTMMYTSCEDHVYGWKDWRGCHVWGCKRCFGRDPVQKGRVENGKHTPGDWEGQVKKCTVCGYVTTKDTTPPVIEGVVNGWDYTADDNDDGTFGTIDFTVRDPAAEGEMVSGIQSVTINSEKQSVQSGQVYQLSAPDGGNGDEGLWYEIVVTDRAGNSTTAKVRVYRRHRVLFVEDRNLTRYIELGVPHGFDLDFPFSLPKEAYFVDLGDEKIKVYYDEENKTYNFGVINSNRTFLLVIPKTNLPELTVRVGNTKFGDYRADAQNEFSYVNPVYKDGEDGYSVTLGITSNQTSYYFATTTRYRLEQLKKLDESGGIKWYRYDPTVILNFIGPSFEDYQGEWYVYAKATNELGTKYVSTPRLILDCEDPMAIVYPSGGELAGKANSSADRVEGTTYWGDLQFKVHDDTPVTVQDGKTVLEPDKNGIYTIPADMDDNVYHNIYIRDACGNTIFYLKNKVRQNTLTQVDTLGEQNLPHGAVLSASLPAKVTVRTAASGDQSVSVPVKWDEAADYAPAARQEQHFTVTGTLDLSDTGIVVPPEQEALLTVTAEVTVAGAPQYRATAASSENGTVTVTNAAKTAGDGTPLFYKGDWVMLSVVPNQGYLLKSLTVVQDGSESVACGGEDETYSFTQPGADVTVSAEFEAIQAAERPNVRVEGVYVYDGSEQTADVRGVDASMNITGDTGTDAGDYTVVVTSRTGQWADGSTDAATAKWRIERAGQSAPAGLRSIAPSAEGGSDGKITGVDTRMEYRAEQERTYTACTGSEIENLPAGNYFVRYAEDRNHFASPEVMVAVGPQAPEITTGSLMDGRVGETYSQTLAASGTSPVVWSIADGALPADLHLNASTGEISGTPTAEGTARFTVMAANSAGSDTKALQITIAAAEIEHPARPAIRVTGSYTYNGVAQTAAVTGYEPGTMDITGHTGTDAGDYTVVVTSRTGQWADGSTDAVTAAWRIERAGQSAPAGLRSIAPSAEGGSDGKITGVDTRMEYRAEQERTYTACTGSKIENLPAGNYFVRYAEDRNHFASTDAEVSVGAGASLADCTITFDAGSGSGSMEPVTVREGGNYILPVCGFTAPANQEFKAWEIGGSEYNVGDPYIVNGNTTVTALWKDSVITPEFTITFDGNGGTPTAHSLRTSGQKLAALPDAFLGGDYSFGGWYMERDGGDRITTETVFWADTTVYAYWVYTGGGGGAYDSRCTIRASAGANGSITPDGNVSVRTGSDQIFLITPDEGYAISDVRIDGRSIGAVMRYTFENVRSAHTIEASFTAASTFADVPAGSYYERAVIWAAANGITNGVGNGLFGVDAPCTRAQAVTFLWRAAGSPAPEISAMPFTDVPVGSYYYDAVLWAVENGIAKGTSETTFGPDASCTRAEIVTFLYRAFGTPAGGDAAFADTTPNAYYAEAVRWAVATGVTTGTSNTTFSPNADCTRAQIVTFLWRCKKTG